MRIVKVLLAIVIGVTIVGCTHENGTKVAQDQAAKIQKGTTTRADLVTMFGPPSSSTIHADGKEMLTWRYSSVRPNASSYIPVVNIFTHKLDMEDTDLLVTLNKEHIVEDYNSTQGAHEFK